MRFLLVCFLLPLASNALAAAGFPVVGLVYNTKEDSSIRYNCEAAEGELITCDMTQVSVRKKLRPADLEAKYQEAISASEADARGLDELCKFAPAFLDLLAGRPAAGLPSQAQSSVQSMNELQRRDAIEQFSALSESCKTREPEGLHRFLRISLEKEARTCLVSTNQFAQTFRPIRNLEGTLVSWSVADNSPQGECGFVQLSRFLPVKPIERSTFVTWQYIAKRATSNPEAQTALGSACSDFEEHEMLFDWKKREIAPKCDYIEFSP